MKIIQVNATDMAGGAENIMWQLSKEYQWQGHDSWIAVGKKNSMETNIFTIPQHKGCWSSLCFEFSEFIVGKDRVSSNIQQLSHYIKMAGEPTRWLHQRLGIEEFNFPGTWQLLNITPSLPDIVHCHNLHGPFIHGGGYFDLRVLPVLSRRIPLVLTLHDAWLLSGHCAHSFDCARWKTGCGQCPDLSIYPAVRRDCTAYNWKRKRDLFKRSKLNIATPCQWLMKKVEESMLLPGIVNSRVIHNGVDLSIFQPGQKVIARRALGIAEDAKVLLFAANGIRHNLWKDFKMMRKAVGLVAEQMKEYDIKLIGLGEEAADEQIGAASIQFVPFQQDPQSVAQYYQAADVYLHAARADTFPNTVLEALACGTPVIGTAIGGIPEQIKGLCGLGQPIEGGACYAENEATGVLVPAGNAYAMAHAISHLLINDGLCDRLGANATSDAEKRFSSRQQASNYLTWYREILENGVSST